MTSIFTDPYFLAVVLGHFTVDMINSLRSIIITYLSEPLGLTNTMIGVVSTIYVIFGSLSQPVFGYFNDRIGTRWVVSGGVAWMAVFLSLAVIIPGESSLIFLIIGSLGSGAVHPAGIAQATLIGRLKLKGQETTASSMFSLFGSLGYFVGPILAGILLQAWGLRGLAVLAVAALPVAGLAFRLKNYFTTSKGPQVETISVEKQGTGMIIALIALAAFQSWAQQNMAAFLPKYLSDAGWQPASYGLMIALFSGGSALGTLFGGRAADRLGKWKVIFFGLGLGAVPFFLIPLADYSWWLYVLVPLSGFLTSSCFNAIVVLAQHLFTVGVGLASGLTLGFIFASGALGTLLSGKLADLYGFDPVFYLSAALALGGGLLGLLFRKR